MKQGVVEIGFPKKQLGHPAHIWSPVGIYFKSLNFSSPCLKVTYNMTLGANQNWIEKIKIAKLKVKDRYVLSVS